MTLKWNAPEVEVDVISIDEHNRRALDGIKNQVYATLAVVLTLSVAFVVALAFLVTAGVG